MMRKTFSNICLKLRTYFRDYRFVVLFTISISFIVLAVFIFKDSYMRFIHSLRDFGLSIAYYFCKLFNIDVEISPMVASIDESYNVRLLWIPLDFENFKEKLGIYFVSLWNFDSFQYYLLNFLSFVSDFARFLLIIVPFIFLFIIWFRRYFDVNEESIDDAESKPLRIYKNKVFNFHLKMKHILSSIYEYLMESKFFISLSSKSLTFIL